MERYALAVIVVLFFAVGCADVPAGPEFNFTGDNNSVTYNSDNDINTGDNNEGDLDNVSGGCCDGNEPDRCFSVPSGTEVPCDTCTQFGGTRDCSVGAPIATTE